MLTFKQLHMMYEAFRAQTSEDTVLILATDIILALIGSAWALTHATNVYAQVKEYVVDTVTWFLDTVAVGYCWLVLLK